MERRASPPAGRARRPSLHRPSYFAYSFFTTVPPFITNFTCSSVVTSFNGSPSTAMMSAHLPGSSVPTLADQPSKSHGVDGRGLNRLQWRHAQAHVDGELVRVEAVRVDGGVGAEGDFHSGREGFLHVVLSDGGDVLHLFARCSRAHCACRGSRGSSPSGTASGRCRCRSSSGWRSSCRPSDGRARSSPRPRSKPR